jgi:hypothetical protein
VPKIFLLEPASFDLTFSSLKHISSRKIGLKLASLAERLTGADCRFDKTPILSSFRSLSNSLAELFGFMWTVRETGNFVH